MRRAVVVSTNPLAAEVSDANLTLTGNDLVYTHAVTSYLASHTIAVGDNLTVSYYRNGDWVIHGIISDTAGDSTTVENWIAPSLLNSWVNFSVSYDPAGYYKDPLGRVWLRGLIKSGTTAANTLLFVLPSGYRPPFRSIHAIDTNGTFGSVEVQEDGEVRTGTTVSATYLSLAGISFRAV